MRQHGAGKVLVQMMFRFNIDETRLSKHTGVSISNISRMKNDPTSNPTYATLKPIADYFGITISQLLGEQALVDGEIIQLPLLSTTEIMPWLTEQHRHSDNDNVVTNRNLSAKAFAFKINQKTLTPIFSYDATVLCDAKEQYTDGDYVLVQQPQQPPVLKQLIQEGSQNYLKSLHNDLEQIAPIDSQQSILAHVVEVRYVN